MVLVADFTVYYCIVMPQGYTTLYSLHSLGPVIMGCVYPHQHLVLYSYLYPIQCS